MFFNLDFFTSVAEKKFLGSLFCDTLYITYTFVPVQ